jgi:hypothetical protein
VAATARRARLPHTRPKRRSADAALGAPWIAPEDDPDWHKNTWGEIVALHERYPRTLARLEYDWYEHPERVETLAALAVWRATIDASSEDPREELAFHNAIHQLARTLDHAPGGARRFNSEAMMPAEWRKPR